MEKDLSRTRKNKHDLAEAERAMMAEMQKIEAAAMKAFEEDAKRDSFAREELDRVLRGKPKHFRGLR